MCSSRLLACAFVLVSIIGAANDAEANFLSQLFRHSDDAARVAPRSAGDGVRGITEDIIKGASRTDVEEMTAAVRGMLKYSRSFDDDVENIKKLTAAFQNAPHEFNRTVPLSERYPFFHFRAHSSAQYDTALQSLARSLVERQLLERFDVADLKVVVLGMADEPEQSAVEVARFKRYISRDVRDEVGPLARLGSVDYASQSKKVAALAPYQGKTIVLVGHVPNDLNDFFVFTGSERLKISIRDWMSAAQEAQVNLIPIGCDSEKLAELGAKGVINSGSVIDRIQRVLLDQPTTIGDLFATLTSKDLTLVINPVEIRVFSNGAEIVARKNREMVGRLIIRGVRPTSRAWQPFERRPYHFPADSFAPCFLSPDGMAFDRCDGEVRLAAARENARLTEREKELVVKRAEPALDRETRIWAGYSLLYVLVWLITTFFTFHGLFVARRIEQETGRSFAAVFSGASIRMGLSKAGRVFTRPIRNFAVIPFIGAPLLGPLVFIVPYMKPALQLFVLIPIAGWVLGQALKDSYKAANEGSLALAVPVLAVGFLACAAYFQVMAGESLFDLRSHRDYKIHVLEQQKVALEQNLLTNVTIRP